MFLPSQNDLYALYMHRCGELRIGKPCREVLALLSEDDRSWRARITAEALSRGVDPRDLEALDGDSAERRALRASTVPLSLRRTLRLEPVTREGDLVHIGPRGGLALLSLVAELPWLERLDLSTLSTLFRSDAYESQRGNNSNNNNSNSNSNSSGVTGNDFFVELRRVCAAHPSLCAVDVSGQPVGCRAAQELLELLRLNPRVRELRMDREGVDPWLAAELDKQLAHNAAIKIGAPQLPLQPSAAMAAAMALAVDRKTLRERQLLRRLVEAEPGLREAFLTAENENNNEKENEKEKDERFERFVRGARVVSTTEATTRSRGLRGDGASLFIIKSGALRAHVDPRGFELRRGDFFGCEYSPDTLFSPGVMSEATRGEVYCVPVEHCGALREKWAERVAAFDETLRRAPVLQCVDKWSRLRACYCATRVAFARGEMALAPGDAFKGLFFVAAGTFGVVATARALAGGGGGGGGGGAKHQNSKNKKEKKEFGPGDVFGEEALVARRQCSSVAVIAEADDCECIVAEGCAARVLQSYLQPVFVTLATEYSQHEELMPITL